MSMPSNLCELFIYVNRIHGLTSTSSSSSDQWIITTPDTSELFIKIFVNDLPHNRTLLYEIKMYDKIKLMVDMGMCSFFIHYFGSGTKCSYIDIVRLGTHNKSLLTHIIRNLYFIYTHAKERVHRTPYELDFLRRYSMSRPVLEQELDEIDIQNMDIMETTLADKKFNYIILQAIPINTVLLAYFEFRHFEIHVVFEILFQIVYTIFVLNKCHIYHNDLHVENIYITTLDTPIRLFFICNHRKYSFDTLYKVMIFDFDQSFESPYGNTIDTIFLFNDFVKSFPYLRSSVSDLFKNGDRFFSHEEIIGHLYRNIRTRNVDACTSNCIVSVFNDSYIAGFLSKDEEVLHHIMNIYERTVRSFAVLV